MSSSLPARIAELDGDNRKKAESAWLAASDLIDAIDRFGIWVQCARRIYGHEPETGDEIVQMIETTIRTLCSLGFNSEAFAGDPDFHLRNCPPKPSLILDPGWYADQNNQVQTKLESCLSYLLFALKPATEALLKQLEYAPDSVLPETADPSAYVLASALLKERFTTYKQFKSWLDKMPESEIRRRKPSPQRLELHTGDWYRYWAAEDRQLSEALDSDAVTSFIDEKNAREAEIRQRKFKRK